MVEEDSRTGEAFSNYFRNQFHSKCDFHFKANSSRLFAHKAIVNLFALKAHITLKEIKNATFNLGTCKALGPNESPLLFFSKNTG